jgi:hypothetical protein
MKAKNKLKKKQDLFNALLKLNHCGFCAIAKNDNKMQLKLFCNYNFKMTK